MDKLEDIEARWAKATPGKWRARGRDVDAPVGGVLCTVYGDSTVCVSPHQDAIAVAAAPEDVAWLVARVRELEGYGRRLGLSEEKWARIGEWQKSHDAEKHIPPGKTVRYSGAIGGAYTYTFTPTSLGTVARCVCACKEYLDVTDYDDW